MSRAQDRPPRRGFLAAAAGWVVVSIGLLAVLCVARSAPAAGARRSKVWEAPASAARRANPVPASSKSLAAGRAVYIAECLDCHGRTGAGNGPGAKDLVGTPPDLRSPAVRRQSDGALFWKISDGRREMPDYDDVLSEEQRWHVVNYLRTFAPKLPAPAPGAPATRRASSTPPQLASGRGPATAPAAAGPVSRDEYERLRREVDSLRRELADVRAGKAPQDAQAQPRQDAVDEAIRDLQKHIEAESSTTPLLLAGNATLGFVDREGTDSTFTAVFRPLLLWKLSDRLLFESKAELRLRETGDEASLSLESANLSYIINDNLVVGGGKFFGLFGLFNDRFHPGKLADEPLIYSGENGLAPHTQLGAFARGAMPVRVDVGRALGLPPDKAGPAELNYAAWVTNGPLLQTSDAERAGLLDFTNFRDANNEKDFGLRVGVLPFPALELGASLLYSPDVSPHGFEDVDALVYGVDLHYFDYVEPLKGTLDVRVEYVWSDAGGPTYDPAGSLGFGPLSFDNFRHGGYAEAGYRPTRASLEFLRDLEFVCRYDRLAEAGLARGDRQRLTLGVLYWLTATTHLRLGYMFDDPDLGPDQSGVFIQASVGF